MVVSSVCAQQGATQAGLTYLCTALARQGATWKVLDLSGSVEFYHAPDRLYQLCDAPEWLNPDSIRRGEWIDTYLPPAEASGEVLLFSAQFSPDVVFHARHSWRVRSCNRAAVTAIGGAALLGLSQEQLEVLCFFFNYVLVGYDVARLLEAALHGGRREHGVVVRAMAPPEFCPDYSLVPLQDFVTVYTGHGCYNGRCRFCDFPVRADRQGYVRHPSDVAADARSILHLRPSVKDIFLTQDSYLREHLRATAGEIRRQCGRVPYNVMLRAEPWVTGELGEELADSGCNDVFIGAEGLDEEVLRILGKGISVEDIFHAVKALSASVNITLGMILFVPGVGERAMSSQLRCLEQLVRYVGAIEPEILTVVNGSEFARHPSRYGIILNATENVLNDSWCFGLSQDIPWTMADKSAIQRWFEHVDDLKNICGDKVDPLYWESFERLRSDISVSFRA
jgi:hypothetical protein